MNPRHPWRRVCALLALLLFGGPLLAEPKTYDAGKKEAYTEGDVTLTVTGTSPKDDKPYYFLIDLEFANNSEENRVDLRSWIKRLDKGVLTDANGKDLAHKKTFFNRKDIEDERPQAFLAPGRKGAVVLRFLVGGFNVAPGDLTLEFPGEDKTVIRFKLPPEFCGKRKP
jgi:hypothetical protein